MTAGAERLAELRDRIDAVDRRLMEALADRQRLVEALARLKADAAAVHDPGREREVMARVAAAAAEAGLSPAVARPLWRLLIARFTQHQLALLDRDQPAPTA